MTRARARGSGFATIRRRKSPPLSDDLINAWDVRSVSGTEYPTTIKQRVRWSSRLALSHTGFQVHSPRIVLSQVGGIMLPEAMGPA